MKQLLLTLAVLVLIAAGPADALWPKPRHFSSAAEGESVRVSACDIEYIVDAPTKAEIEEMLGWYLTKVFKCRLIRASGHVSLRIAVQDSSLLVPTQVGHEQYSLELGTDRQWLLAAPFYPGFLRGLETFSQLLQQGEGGHGVSGLPISVSDSPSFKWRGLMIDTSRHFLPLETILRAIDSMVYSKLNVLHWHIVDEDAFPMQVPSLPELSGAGSVGGVFSGEDIQQVIAYARTRAIRVIPEIDSPAHTESWGRSERFAETTLNCNGLYMGQFDPTLPLTWELITEVMKYVNATFADEEYVHFGGDEVTFECWGQRQSILDWMAAHGVADYPALAVYYRQQQKAVWRNISASKKVIYWANEDIDLPLQEDDVIDWWGVSANVGRMVGRKNEVILSNYDLTYLDIGFNNMYGNVYGAYEHWRKMYSYEPRVPSVNVIGGETCMWNEIGNRHTFDQKVVQRASVLAERLWNVEVDIGQELKSIATRLTAHAARLRARGFKVWPVTVGLCEEDMSLCF